MIQSKFQEKAIPTFWIALSFIILFFCGMTYYVIDHLKNFTDTENHRKAIITIVLGCSSLLFLSVWLKTVATIITIDTNQNIIAFTNYFTKKTKIYSFNDFDGYVQTVVINSKTGVEDKALYLLKDKKVNKKIVGSYYSNIEELEEGLKSLAYFGFERFGIVKSLKILFKQPILE